MLKAFRGIAKQWVHLVVTVILVFTATLVWSQQSGNPFEIKPRLGQMPESTGPAAADTPTGNPFDIIAPKEAQAEIGGQKNAPVVLPGPDRLSTPAPLAGFILGLLLFSFLLLAVLTTLFRPYFQKIFRAFGNENMLSQAHREYQQGQRVAYLVLYLTFMINAGIFLFLLLRRVYVTGPDYKNWILLLLCIGAVAGLFLLKHLLLYFIGRVFPVQKEISVYNFTIMVFSTIIGIFLFAANVFLALGAENLLEPGVKIIATIVALVYGFRSVRGLLIGSRFIPLHVFHFLLYICTAEIAPVAVVVKLIMNQL